MTHRLCSTVVALLFLVGEMLWIVGIEWITEFFFFATIRLRPKYFFLSRYCFRLRLSSPVALQNRYFRMWSYRKKLYLFKISEQINLHCQTVPYVTWTRLVYSIMWILCFSLRWVEWRADTIYFSGSDDETHRLDVCCRRVHYADLWKRTRRLMQGTKSRKRET